MITDLDHTWKTTRCSKLQKSTTKYRWELPFFKLSLSLILSIALNVSRSSQSTGWICPLSYLFASFSKRSNSPRSFLGTYSGRYYHLMQLSKQMPNQKHYAPRTKTFPGVVVGNDPSACFPNQSLSFCFPVFNCILLLNRRIVAPPINASSFPHDTSQTWAFPEINIK